MITFDTTYKKIQLLFVSSLLGMLSMLPVTHAAELPGFDKQVIINAREQSVDQFLSELFGQLDVPARISENVSGSVNGDFRKSAREVFRDIASSFQLSIYYDGAVAHIYPSNDVVHNVLYMPKSTARNIERASRKMGMLDSHNNLSVADVGLIVTGAPQFVDQVEQMSVAMRKSGSKPAVVEHDTYRTFQLRYAWADDVSLVIGGETVVVPGVASLIRSLIEPGALNSSPAQTLRTPDSPTLEGLKGQGLKSVGNPAAREERIPQSIADRSTDKGSTDRTRIVADPLSNSVIIRDKSNRMKAYAELISTLDKEPQMIEIEATIIDLDTDKLRELGVNWRALRGDGEALLGQGTIADELLRPNSDITPTGEGGIVSLVLGSQQQFIARIKALETQGAARIVSKPHVMTLSNVEALLDTTSTFFVRVEGQEEVDLFDVSVGTTLRVTPHVYDRDGSTQIKLRVNIEDGSASDRLVDQIPVVENSTIATQAIIDVGQSLLIGGLVRETKGNATTRVPVLGNIPVLGSLFRSTRKTSTRQERMFLITPRVTNPRVAGKRFSAPIVSGSEAEIIQSAPTRLGSTQRTLDLLDEANPIEQALPRGNGLRSDMPVFSEPFRAIEVMADSASDAEAPNKHIGATAIQDRLPQSDVIPVGSAVGGARFVTAPAQIAVSNGSALQAGLSGKGAPIFVPSDVNDDWQIVGAEPVASSTRASAASYSTQDTENATGRSAERFQPLAEDTVDLDTWQVVN